jgi:hypothetical protein
VLLTLFFNSINKKKCDFYMFKDHVSSLLYECCINFFTNKFVPNFCHCRNSPCKQTGQENPTIWAQPIWDLSMKSIKAISLSFRKSLSPQHFRSFSSEEVVDEIEVSSLPDQILPVNISEIFLFLFSNLFNSIHSPLW